MADDSLQQKRPSLRDATMTPRRFYDTEGMPFPYTVFDDRGGRETRPGWYEMIDENKNSKRLPSIVFGAVKAKVDEAEGTINRGDLSGAFALLNDALNLLPEPRQQWNAAGWILVAMGEWCVRAGKYKAAEDPLQDAMICPGALGNPWVHLRLGQVRFELGNKESAANELARAYMGGGREVFDEQDPKYFAYVETVLKPPPGMDCLP